MELKINNENKKSSEPDKNKELLISLLKQKLENRIIKLERRNKIHLNLMHETTQTIKEITEWSINANNQIKEKTKKNEKPLNQIQKTINKNKKYEKIEVRSNIRKQSYRSKTPLRTKTSKLLIPDETKSLTVNRNYIKSNKFFTINTKNEKIFDTKPKSNSIYVKKKRRKTITNNNLNIETEALRRPSEMSNKSNKTSTSKRKKNTETPSRKKTPFKKKNINEKIEKNNLTIKLNENKSSENVINSKIIKKVKKKKDEITKMETELQKGEFLTDNDPLLIAPITDLDFFIDKKLSNSNISISFDIKEKERLNLLFKNIDDKIYKIISDFLDIDDLIQFKNVSKFYRRFNSSKSDNN